MNGHFPHLRPLTLTHGTNLQLKTCTDVPNQKVNDKIVHQLNTKKKHFYNLPFALQTLRKAQCKDIFFSSIISYLENNHLYTNIKYQQSIILDTENYILFNSLLFHSTVKSIKTVEHKLALCIPIE